MALTSPNASLAVKVVAGHTRLYFIHVPSAAATIAVLVILVIVAYLLALRYGGW